MDLCLKDKPTSNICCMCQLWLFRTSQQTPRGDFLHCQSFPIDSRKWLWIRCWLASYDLSPNFYLRPTFCPNVSERSFHWNCCGCQTFLNEVGGRGILHSRRSGLRSFRPIHLCPILLQIQIVRGRRVGVGAL